MTTATATTPIGTNGERAPLDLASLRVSVHYYARRYTARIVKLTPRAIVAEWTLRNGATVSRRIPLTLTKSQRANGGHHAPTLTAASANAVTRAQTAFDTFEQMLNAGGGYRPTLLGDGLQALLANTYDDAQAIRRDVRRALRRTR